MQQADFEKLLSDTLAAHGRSLRTQETYTLMLRLFGRYLVAVRSDKTLDTVVPLLMTSYSGGLRLGETSSTSCHRASSASGTTASSRPGIARTSLAVGNCWGPSP